ncbi:MAG: hypothetical protein RLZZ630_602, partial [Bacteroidota bacterium]
MTISTRIQRLLFILVLFVLGAVYQASAQEKCLSEILFQEEARKNPALLQNRENLEQFTESFAAHHPEHNAQNRSAGVTKIIPVVVHVIHYGGIENISKAQIID